MEGGWVADCNTKRHHATQTLRRSYAAHNKSPGLCRWKSAAAAAAHRQCSQPEELEFVTVTGALGLCYSGEASP